MLFTQAAGLVCPGVDRKSEWYSCGEVRRAGGTVATVAPILELSPACSQVSQDTDSHGHGCIQST